MTIKIMKDTMKDQSMEGEATKGDSMKQASMKEESMKEEPMKESMQAEPSTRPERTRTTSRALAAIFAVLAFTLAAVAAADGAWITQVPSKDHERQNPYHGQQDAIAAGHRLFLDHCAQCHGDDANGTKKRPPLRSERVQQQATEGDIHWLLVNGNMKKGMPSWAKLPDQQLWQVVTYVRSLHE